MLLVFTAPVMGAMKDMGIFLSFVFALDFGSFVYAIA